jgi:hypothetical protein
MCGGGGSPATITMPDYSAFNQQFELQKSAIDQGMNSGAQQLQQQLVASSKEQQKLLQQELELKKANAEDAGKAQSKVDAQAMRMAALIGPPPPEKSATAPVVASERGMQTKKGKSALRIGLDSTGRMGQGAGLNIT